MQTCKFRNAFKIITTKNFASYIHIYIIHTYNKAPDFRIISANIGIPSRKKLLRILGKRGQKYYENENFI